MSTETEIVVFGGSPKDYDLLRDAYTGGGGFKDGQYLIPHPREDIDKYYRRQGLSYYINYVKPVVRAHVNPIFKTPPARIYNDKLYEVFLKNVDGKGTKMDKFMENVAKEAKLYGGMFLVIDMMPVDGVINKKMVQDGKLLPYLYKIMPNKVTDWAVDKFGNYILFKYTCKSTVISDDGNKTESTETYTWTTTKCIIETDSGNPRVMPNNLGMIPVIPVFGANVEGIETALVPTSDILCIAKTNYTLFNACSELRERNRDQAFSLLTYPVGEEDSADVVDELNVGTSNVLLYKDGKNSPEFITPEAQPSEILANEIKFMVQEIYRMASLQLATGVQIATSGVSKEWDNVQLFQTIAEFANTLQDVEYRIARLFGLYLGNENMEVTINYNNQFGIVDSTDTLNMATQALALNICPEYNYEMKRKVIRDTLKDQTSEVVNKVLDDLESSPDNKNPIETDPTVLSYAK